LCTLQWIIPQKCALGAAKRVSPTPLRDSLCYYKNMNHKGKRLFITGIPTSGKSYLAQKLANKLDGFAVLLDDLRKKISADEKYKKWTDFYFDKDEEKYFLQNSPEERWQDFVLQSEGLWPAFKAEIKKYQDEPRPVIFECVNLLPHLAKRSLNFPGIVLIGKSYEETLDRNRKGPRWGTTQRQQEMEAKNFFFEEGPLFKKEAIKYGYPVFETADEAFNYCLEKLS